MKDNLITAGVILAICGVVGLIGYGIYWNWQHPCIRSHQELRHHAAYTELMPIHSYDAKGNLTGTTLVPIYHPAYDAMETFCDERKGVKNNEW